MSKKNRLAKEEICGQNTSLVEAFRSAIIDMTRSGLRRFDVAGYPYEAPGEALRADWQAIGHDGQCAIEMVAQQELSANDEQEKQPA